MMIDKKEDFQKKNADFRYFIQYLRNEYSYAQSYKIKFKLVTGYRPSPLIYDSSQSGKKLMKMWPLI